MQAAPQRLKSPNSSTPGPQAASGSSAPSSRPGTADERRRELNKALRDRHTPQHRLHFFGRPGSSGTTRPLPSATRDDDAADVGLEGPTWSSASLVNTQSLAGRIEATEHVQLSPMQRHMSKQMRIAADRAAKAEADATTQETLQYMFEGLPWWRRIVVDEGFRRRVATLAARAIRAQEGYHRPDAEAQNISLPPMFRWEAMSADNRVVQPTPGASCGPLDGVTHRWKGPFPPNGFVQLTPNAMNLRATAEKKGPLHINIYVPVRPKRLPHLAAHDGDDVDAMLEEAAGGGRGDGVEHRTIGRMISDYEEAQRRKFELEMEVKRQQREAALSGGAGGGDGMGGARGKLAMDDEGFLTIDGVRLEQKYLGTLRPSFLLLRWRIMCNAIHEYGASVSGSGVGRQGFATPTNVNAMSNVMPSSAASMFGGSMPGSSPATPRRHNTTLGDDPTSPHLTTPSSTGAQAVPAWLEGIPRFGVPVFAVEAKPAHVVYDQSTDKRRVEAFPPSKTAGTFTSIRREDIPESRRQFLFQAPACRKAVHRLFQELPQDATGRIHQAAYVEFMLDLLHVFLPTFHTQSNIEVAEDEWLCRGVPEFPDFTIFYRNLFDFPLILCRERNTMTEEQYVSVWDLLYEALHGREKLLGWYEVDIKRTQSLMGPSVAPRSASPSTAASSTTHIQADMQAGWKVHLPPYLCPTAMESAIVVPLRKNADHYALHRVANHIETTHQQVQQSDPSRRTFLIHRLASTHLANRSNQESQSGELSPAASFRLATAASAGRRRRRQDGTSGVASGDESDDDYLASPLLEGGDTVQFPSLALQVKQMAERDKKLSVTAARHPRSKHQMSERQREEARRINEMLAIENKASSLNLYEEVYEAPELPRDDIDDILDYCSELSDTDLLDDGDKDDDDDGEDLIQSPEVEGLGIDAHDAEVARIAAAKAAAAAKKKRSIRTLYQDARYQREQRAERELQEAQEAKLQQQRRAAQSQKQQRLSPPDVSLSGRRRLSSISPTKPAALRRASLLGPMTGASKSVRSDDGLSQVSSHPPLDEGLSPLSGAADATVAATDVGVVASGQHMADPQPKLVLSADHAQRVRRAERERVRQLALPGGHTLISPTTTSSTVTATPIVAPPLQYRTFLASHLHGGARTVLDDGDDPTAQMDPQTRHATNPVAPAIGATLRGSAQGHQRRPETAMSAHAALSVNPFKRLTSTAKHLMGGRGAGVGAVRPSTGTTAAGSVVLTGGDPQLSTEDPNSLQRSHIPPRPTGGTAALHREVPELRQTPQVSPVPRLSGGSGFGWASRPTSGESLDMASHRSSVNSAGYHRILLTPAQAQAHDEKRRELLSLLLREQQQEQQQPQTTVEGIPELRDGNVHGAPFDMSGIKGGAPPLHISETPRAASVQVDNDCSLRGIDDDGVLPTDGEGSTFGVFPTTTAGMSANGCPPAPRRPRMPSFMRHNNQTKMRTVVGDLQTSVLASSAGAATTSPLSHPASRSGSKTVTPMAEALMPGSLGMSTSRRLTSSVLSDRAGQGVAPPAVYGAPLPPTVPSSTLPIPGDVDHVPGAAGLRHAEVVAGNPPPTITPMNGFMQRSKTIAVTPIRPPKYRFPKFKGPQGPPKHLFINGHLVVGQHPTMAMVQRLNLGVPLSPEQQARQDQKPGSRGSPRSPTTSGVEHATEAAPGGLPALPLQGSRDVATGSSPQATPRGCSADRSTPRPLGGGLRSPRTVLATELERTVIVVPTSSGRWDMNDSSMPRSGSAKQHSQQRSSPPGARHATTAGELSLSLENILNISEIPI